MRTCFLQTPHLYFSHWTQADLPLARSLWGDPAVARYICARGVFTEEEIRARLELEIASQQDRGVQYWGEAYYPPTGRMHPTYRLPL